MVEAIRNIEIADNKLIIDQRKPSDFKASTQCVLPSGVPLLICSNDMNEASKTIHRIMAEYSLNSLSLIIQEPENFNPTKYRALEPEFIVYAGLINEGSNFKDLKSKDSFSEIKFTAFKKLPDQHKEFISDKIDTDIINPTCASFKGSTRQIVEKMHEAASKSIVDSYPCILAFREGRIVAFLGWIIKDAIPSVSSFHSTHWIENSLPKEVRSYVHGYHFNILGEQNKQLPFCAYAHINNTNSFNLFLKNNYLPFAITIHKIKG